ncbi:hypothetical protein [Acinetobacter sp. ANC 4633]|nr:hypothetical protein [Acinetobacter sp. ANC 4633]
MNAQVIAEHQLQSHEVSMLISNQEARHDVDLATYQQSFQHIIWA